MGPPLYRQHDRRGDPNFNACNGEMREGRVVDPDDLPGVLDLLLEVGHDVRRQPRLGGYLIVMPSRRLPKEAKDG